MADRIDDAERNVDLLAAEKRRLSDENKNLRGRIKAARWAAAFTIAGQVLLGLQLFYEQHLRNQLVDRCTTISQDVVQCAAELRELAEGGSRIEKADDDVLEDVEKFPACWFQSLGRVVYAWDGREFECARSQGFTRDDGPPQWKATGGGVASAARSLQ